MRARPRKQAIPHYAQLCFGYKGNGFAAANWSPDKSVGAREAGGSQIPCSRFGSMINRFMRIIARRTLREFIELRAGHKDQPALKTALDAWFDEARKGRWTNVADIKRLYRTASVVSAERVVFNIKGNDYRLVTAIDFEKGIVWIKWLGSHKDYDRINVRRIEHGD
jgi:mRNA interferase HigB